MDSMSSDLGEFCRVCMNVANVDYFSTLSFLFCGDDSS